LRIMRFLNMRNSHKALSISGLCFSDCVHVLARLVCLVCLVLSISHPLFAQDDNQAIIRLKQRLLKHKADDNASAEAADSSRTLHLMIAGNVYQTEKHVNYCYDEASGKYNFRDELKYIQPILSLGDITIADLKTSFGGDIKNMFSAPDEFALALKYSGINTLMHANLHTANVSRETFNRTRNLMNDFELYYTGAFSDNLQRQGNYPLIINKKGFKIAVLNYGTLNKRPPISRNFYINEIDKDQIERDMRLVHAYKPDFTIVYFDWGANMQETPSLYQMEIAQLCFQTGANLVVGTHPNAPMRLDYMNYMSNGVPKEGIVAYSLGNLIASNDEVRNRNGYILDIELHKNNYSGEVNLGDWGVIPVYTYYDTSSVQGKMNIYTVPCSAVEAGDILPKIPYIEKRRVVNGAYEVRKLLGSTADEIQYNENELVANNVMEVIDLTNAAWNNKYSQKRKEDVPESAPPVLPVASIGTNNPPSLAKIYEEPVKIKPKATNKEGGASTPDVAKTNKLEEERRKAEEVFAGKSESGSIPANPINPVNFNADNSTAGKEPVAANDKASQKPAAAGNNEAAPSTGIGNSATVKSNNPGSANTEKTTEATPGNKTTANPGTEGPDHTANKAGTVNDSANTIANKQSSSNPDAGTEKDVNTVAADNRNGTVKKKPALTGNESGTTTKQSQDYGDPAKKNVSKDKYHTEGNDYNLNEEARTNAAKKTVASPEEKKEEPALNAAPKSAGGITTNIKEDIKPNLQPAKEKTVKMVMDTFYRIQFYALKKYLPLDTNYYTHLKGYEVVEENGYFKYLLGRFKQYEECFRYWKNQIQPRYKESFIVKYIDGKRVLE
jgi:poly-gamma-glutamate capsule biosynthesis protein CapA/YwtB (metallophosphatase superfamily)